jgi:adenylosuccinate synthase
MSTLAIQGCQWGDEGKGKITDYYAEKADVVVRSQGGNNAGHSIVHQGTRYALKLLPSGILNPQVTNVLADGVVINPWALLEEIENIHKMGVTTFTLLISNRAQILMPYHIDIDHAREGALGNAKIGTTGKGIGPCYEDMASRMGLRMGDLLDPLISKKDLRAS